MSMNLTKYLSTAGVASRRGATELIKAGRIKIDGRRVTEPGFRVEPGMRVEFNGCPVENSGEKYYVMLNKPAGYVCSSDDRFATQKAIDLIELANQVRLFSAGRLDKESEGLIIFSNDGDFVAELSHPRHRVLKEYHVSTDRLLKEDELDTIRRGIHDDGDFLKVVAVEPLPGRAAGYRFILNEGRKREIRRLIRAVGAKTLRLIRVRIGQLELGHLTPGKWRHLTPEEIKLARGGSRGGHSGGHSGGRGERKLF